MSGAGAGRRHVLVGAAAAVSLSACDVLTDDEVEPGPGAPTRERDRQLADAAAAVEAGLVRLLHPLTSSGSARERRAARASLQVHLRHLELLDTEPPVPSGPRLDQRQARARRDRLRRAEEVASRRHRDSALRAASGPFARVLAAMSAASAQQAQVWRERA